MGEGAYFLWDLARPCDTFLYNRNMGTNIASPYYIYLLLKQLMCTIHNQGLEKILFM